MVLINSASEAMPVLSEPIVLLNSANLPGGRVDAAYSVV